MIDLSREHVGPVKRQIYEQMKGQILYGGMEAGEALPSTRELARDLNISRSTVVEAYDMLLAEGFLTSRQGAPTRVAEGLSMEHPGESPSSAHASRSPEPLADFRTGRPALSQFPGHLWTKYLAKAAEELPLRQYGYTGAQGLIALRAEISAWLSRSRGFLVNPEDIFITAGATHALHLLASLLSPYGKKVLIEDPCHLGMLETFLRCGCEIVPIPVDDQGLQTQRLQDCGNACAIYVTPSHQFPLGGILPASRRAALIRFARENDLYILEDDYDSEFRYSGAPIAPLCAMDAQRVVYVGTFSKTVFPALRVGYVVLPKPLQAQWRELRMYMDVQNPPFEQAALAEFFKSRKLDRHIRAMRKLYGKRRQTLLDALEASFGNTWAACGDAAGLHVAIRFPGRQFDEAFGRWCAEKGILITPLEAHCIEKGRHESELVMGYGHLEPSAIQSGVQLLAEVIRQP